MPVKSTGPPDVSRRDAADLKLLSPVNNHNELLVDTLFFVAASNMLLLLIPLRSGKVILPLHSLTSSSRYTKVFRRRAQSSQRQGIPSPSADGSCPLRLRVLLDNATCPLIRVSLL